MKSITLTLIPFFIFVLSGKSQYDEGSIKLCEHIVKLIREDSIKELSTLVIYPLREPNPIPDITTPNEFILAYPFLFDSMAKLRIAYYNATDSTIIFHQGNYGLDNGHIWVDNGGGIISIWYATVEREKLQQKLQSEIQNSLYPSIKYFKQNIYTCKTEKYLFRVDCIDSAGFCNYRYASWKIGHNMSEKPDLILFNDDSENDGTSGNSHITFKNGDWSYIIENYFNEISLSIRLNGETIGAYKCTVIK